MSKELTITEVCQKYKVSKTKLYILRKSKNIEPTIIIENGRTKHYYTEEILRKLGIIK